MLHCRDALLSMDMDLMNIGCDYDKMEIYMTLGVDRVELSAYGGAKE